MKYLVLECGLSYAIVLDEEGRFLKVANLGYQVGETIDHIVLFTQPRQKTSLRRRVLSLAAVAACLCLIAFLTLEYVLLPVGSVRLQINPDVSIEINRLNYVIGLEPFNDDGEALIDGYSYSWKTTETVSDELADLAMELGYLQEGGNIRLTVDSNDDEWKTATEEKILTELELHLQNRVTVTTTEEDDHKDLPASQQEIVINPGELISGLQEESGSSSSESPTLSDDQNDDSKPVATIKPTPKPTEKPTPKPTLRPVPKPDEDEDEDEDGEDGEDEEEEEDREEEEDEDLDEDGEDGEDGEGED